jgi:hypothetical protein
VWWRRVGIISIGRRWHVMIARWNRRITRRRICGRRRVGIVRRRWIITSSWCAGSFWWRIRLIIRSQRRMVRWRLLVMNLHVRCVWRWGSIRIHVICFGRICFLLNHFFHRWLLGCFRSYFIFLVFLTVIGLAFCTGILLLFFFAF